MTPADRIKSAPRAWIILKKSSALRGDAIAYFSEGDACAH
jgi:hypothetical protein